MKNLLLKSVTFIILMPIAIIVDAINLVFYPLSYIIAQYIIKSRK